MPLIVTYGPAQTGAFKKLSKEKRAGATKRARTTATLLAERIAQKAAYDKGVVTTQRDTHLATLAKRGIRTLEITRANQQTLEALIFLVLTAQNLPAIVASNLSGVEFKDANAPKTTPPKEKKSAAEKKPPAAKAAAPKASRPAAPASKAAPARRAKPARVEKPAETKVQTPQTKFRLSTGQKIHRTVNLLLVAAAIGAVFAPISTGVMLIITFGAGITGIASSIFAAFSIRDSKLNFKGVGILEINSNEFSPEAQAAIRQGLVELNLGRGINMVFKHRYTSFASTSDRWEAHNPAEKEGVEVLLTKHLSTRTKTSIFFKTIEDGQEMNVVFYLTYMEQGDWQSRQKPLLTLRQRNPY